jgi:hypothetical protein
VFENWWKRSVAIDCTSGVLDARLCPIFLYDAFEVSSTVVEGESWLECHVTYFHGPEAS